MILGWQDSESLRHFLAVLHQWHSELWPSQSSLSVNKKQEGWKENKKLLKPTPPDEVTILMGPLLGVVTFPTTQVSKPESW